MGKFSGILICTDLDETLLDTDKSISKENIDAIEYFKNNGGSFTFITGRGVNGVGKSIEKVKPNVPVGCLNGGAIFDWKNNKNLYELELDKSVIPLLLELEEKFETLGVEVITHSDNYFRRINEVVKWHIDLEKLPVLDGNDFDKIPGKWGKCLLVEQPQIIDEVMEYIKTSKNANGFDFVRSCGYFYEVLPKGSSKGSLLLKLAEILGIDKNKTIAIGDNENDIPMLKEAKLGIAVENAVQKAKDAANMITVANTQHALAKIIYDLDSGKINL